MAESAAASALPTVADNGGALGAYRSFAEVTEARARVAQLMREVLKEGVHYGKVTASENAKPSLWQPGAELIAFTFRIGNEHLRIDDLSVRDDRGHLYVVRYRILTVGIHIPSGQRLAEGVGECSSDEEKYAWRRATCVEEYNAASEWARRIKFYANYDRGTVDEVQQVRQNPADMANTVLKMADKRSYIGMVLHSTAASEFCTQDMDDEEIARALTEGQADRVAREMQNQQRAGGSGISMPRDTAEGAPADAATGGGPKAPAAASAPASNAKSTRTTKPAAGAAAGDTATVAFRAFVADVTVEQKPSKKKPGTTYSLVSVTLGKGVGEGIKMTSFNVTHAEVARSAQKKGEMIEGQAIRGKFGIDIRGTVNLVTPSAEDMALNDPAGDAGGGEQTAQDGDGKPLDGI